MTTSSELSEKLKHIKSFIGVYPRDQLPIVDKYPVSLIINTDPHNKPGQHWVAIHINYNRFGIYFDSYGLPPLNREFTQFLDTYCDCWTYNHTMIQGYSSINCGEFCVLFVILKALDYNMIDIMKLFSKSYTTNDEIIDEIYKKL